MHICIYAYIKFGNQSMFFVQHMVLFFLTGFRQCRHTGISNSTDHKCKRIPLLLGTHHRGSGMYTSESQECYQSRITRPNIRDNTALRFRLLWIWFYGEQARRSCHTKATVYHGNSSFCSLDQRLQIFRFRCFTNCVFKARLQLQITVYCCFLHVTTTQIQVISVNCQLERLLSKMCNHLNYHMIYTYSLYNEGTSIGHKNMPQSISQ